MRFLPLLLLIGPPLASLAFSGCATTPPAPNISQPPASTREACDSIRYFFERFGARSVAPREVTTECHLRITAGDFRGGQLRDYLEKTAWKRDPNYGKGAVPHEFAYETPSTRCTIEEIPNYNNGGKVQTGVGVSGGGGVSSTFGLGMSVGSRAETNRDYKIDCVSK
jgi:hypothetical protein